MSRPYFFRKTIKPAVRLIETMGESENSITNQINDTDSQTSQSNENPLLEIHNQDNDITQRLDLLDEQLTSQCQPHNKIRNLHESPVPIFDQTF